MGGLRGWACVGFNLKIVTIYTDCWPVWPVGHAYRRTLWRTIYLGAQGAEGTEGGGGPEVLGLACAGIELLCCPVGRRMPAGAVENNNWVGGLGAQGAECGGGPEGLGLMTVPCCWHAGQSGSACRALWRAIVWLGVGFHPPPE